MKTTHTPTPWRSRSGGNRNKFFVEQSGNAEVVICTIDASVAIGKNEANADFIALAVNSHDELLAACKAALLDESTAHDVAELCRKAIAKAEGNA